MLLREIKPNNRACKRHHAPRGALPTLAVSKVDRCYRALSRSRYRDTCSIKRASSHVHQEISWQSWRDKGTRKWYTGRSGRSPHKSSKVVLIGSICRIKGDEAVCQFEDPDQKQTFIGRCNLTVLANISHSPGTRFAFRADKINGEHRLRAEPLSIQDPRDDANWVEANRAAGENYKDFELDGVKSE